MLKTFDLETFYHAKLDENLCKKSFSYLENFFPKFESKDWDCDIRTSRNVTDNILNASKLHELKMNIVSHIENYFHSKGFFIEGYISGSWINIYEENFFQVIDSLILLSFGKQIYNLISFYFYEKHNPDGTENSLIIEETGEELYIRDVEDLWNLILRVKPDIFDEKG